MSEMITRLGQIKIGRSGEISYIAFQPPLTEDQFLEGPRPEYVKDGDTLEHGIVSNELFSETNSQQLGFDSLLFDVSTIENLLQYAERLAAYIGTHTLDRTVYTITNSPLFER